MVRALGRTVPVGVIVVIVATVVVVLVAAALEPTTGGRIGSPELRERGERYDTWQAITRVAFLVAIAVGLVLTGFLAHRAARRAGTSRVVAIALAVVVVAALAFLPVVFIDYFGSCVTGQSAFSGERACN